MNYNLISFDIETHKDIGEFNGNIKQFRPLGISCAAVKYQNGTKVFYSHDKEKMTIAQVRDIVDYLEMAIELESQIVTWNGAGFDFDILYEESGWDSRVPVMAENSIDLMFQFFCIKGYFLGLDAACKGLGLPGKTEGMHGDLVPKLWQGTDEDREKAKSYVRQDAICTYDLAKKILEVGGIKWISKSGKPNRCDFNGLITVKESLELPLPDTSWMIGDNRPTREDMIGWIFSH